MTKIKNEYLKYKFHDEGDKRYFIDLNVYDKINFCYKAYKNNKLTLMENLEVMIYLIHNDENNMYN